MNDERRHCPKDVLALKDVRSNCVLAPEHEGECEHQSVTVTWGSSLRVVAAAIRWDLKDWQLVHAEARELILSVPAPGRHHNVKYLSRRLGLDATGVEDQGFLLSDGTFATRERALEVAKAAGQIIRRCGGDERKLISENVW